jgi:sugar phosphate permease
MNLEDARKVIRYRWVIFGIMSLAYIFVYFHRTCTAVVALDIQKEFSASAGMMGLLASAYFYPYALMQFPAGLLSDSLGPRKTVTIFLVLAGIGSILFGIAPQLGWGVAARALVGIGVSMVFIPTMKITSQWFRASEFSFMAAILNTMGGVGALTAAMPLAVLSGLLGWRHSFELIGAATIVVAILVVLIVRNRPQDMGLPSLAEIDHVGPGDAPEPRPIPVWEGARRVVTERYFWPIAVWFVLVAGAALFGFGAMWSGPYLMHVYGMTRAEAGSILNMLAVGLIVGSPFMSLLSDRVLRSRKKVLILMTGILCFDLLVLNLFPGSLSRFALYVVFFVFWVSCSAVVVIGFTTTKELFPVRIAGTSVGTVNLFPFLGGAFMQIIFGRILDAYPKTAGGEYSVEAYSSILLILLMCAMGGLLCTFLMKETFGRSET